MCSGLDVPAFYLQNAVDVEHCFAMESDAWLRDLLGEVLKPRLLLGNVLDVDPAALPSVDIFTAGFPCQPFSRMGLGGGLGDARTQPLQVILAYLVRARPAPPLSSLLWS